MDSPPNTEFIQSAVLAIAAFAPGLIMTYVRSQLMSGRVQSASQAMAEYALISAAYYAALLVFAEQLFSSWKGLFVAFFVAPCFIGLILGLNAQLGLSRWALGKLRIQTVHPALTAWDYIFGSKKEDCWIIITLKDGSKVCGHLKRSKSFASSDLERRDLFVDEVTDERFQPLDDKNTVRGMWISENEIRTIELCHERT